MPEHGTRSLHIIIAGSWHSFEYVRTYMDVRLRFIFMSLLALAGCYPATKITGSWKNPAVTRNYHTVFVAALTANTVARATLEKEMVTALQERGMQPVASIEEFPPGFEKDSVSHAQMMKRVKERSSDAILTISLQKKETESRYVSGGYAPMTRWDYYENFRGYYSYWWPLAYGPGYYQEQDVFFLETNLYDADSELLIWSAQSRTWSNGGLHEIAREFALRVVDKMREDGVLR